MTVKVNITEADLTPEQRTEYAKIKERATATNKARRDRDDRRLMSVRLRQRHSDGTVAFAIRNTVNGRGPERDHYLSSDGQTYNPGDPAPEPKGGVA